MGAPPRSPAFSISTWLPNAPFYWRRYGGSLWLRSARLRHAERPRASGAESLRSGWVFPSTTSPIPQFFGGPCSSTPGADQASFRFSFFGTALHAVSLVLFVPQSFILSRPPLPGPLLALRGWSEFALLYRGCVAVAVALASCAPAGAQCSPCVCFVVFCIVSRYKAGVLSGVRRLSISTAMGGLLGTGQ